MYRGLKQNMFKPLSNKKVTINLAIKHSDIINFKPINQITSYEFFTRF